MPHASSHKSTQFLVACPGYKLWSQNSFAKKVGMQIKPTGSLDDFLCYFADSITELPAVFSFCSVAKRLFMPTKKFISKISASLYAQVKLFTVLFS